MQIKTWRLIPIKDRDGEYPQKNAGNCNRSLSLRPRLHEQIKQSLFEQIRPGLLHTDREFEHLKEVLFAQVNAA